VQVSGERRRQLIHDLAVRGLHQDHPQRHDRLGVGLDLRMAASQRIGLDAQLRRVPAIARE
jgi:hypothetical protein